MTATAQSNTGQEEIGCEVRTPETDDVLGYVVAGGTAACLERALAQNGFWLVPVRPTYPKGPRPAIAA